MEQIVIEIRDHEKAKVLMELLSSLDFVNSVQRRETNDDEASIDVGEESMDLFSLAGIWKDRDITLESIRQKAWPRQNS